jgi:glycogen operon protein
MLLAGDEFRRTQRGNNNAYCQDNGTSWVDWSLLERHQDLVQFARQVFAFRRAHHVLRREAFYSDRDIQWFDPGGHAPDWLDPSQKRVACLIHGQGSQDLYLMFNADTEPASFVLPELAPTRRWRLAIDTAQPLSVDDDAQPRAGIVNGTVYALASRSSAILAAAFPEPPASRGRHRAPTVTTLSM